LIDNIKHPYYFYSGYLEENVMDVMNSFVSVFGFFPTLIFGLLAFWLGKRGGIFAATGIGAAVVVIAVSMIGVYGPAGRDGGFLVFAAFAMCGILFGGVTLASFLYFSGILGKLLTPKK
jgi:hypothetical protein